MKGVYRPLYDTVKYKEYRVEIQDRLKNKMNEKIREKEEKKWKIKTVV